MRAKRGRPNTSCTSLRARTARSFVKTLKGAQPNGLSLTRYWPDDRKAWGKNHLTSLIQHDWLHVDGAAGATLVCKFLRNISA